ncbi:MAG: PD-(D/E)XK nuclease family protein, partial [Ruminococcus sp.]|nr:PD-(D/E)XK nuclease family protein [Ruminococcus sp.]
MLQFILGKSGSGKTTEAVNILSTLCINGNKKLLMLVPDQSSFETETTFLDILGPKLSRDVLVFGFSRLSNYVFKNTGNIPENVIDDGIRKIIMRKALDEVQDNLKMFTSGKSRKSVLELMLHSLMECKKDNITCDMLESTAEKIENKTLKQKLLETSLVLSAYDALLEKTYVDPLDNLNRLKDILETERLFEGYTIVVDSFSGFTYQQLEVIRVLINQCKDFYVTVNIDINDKNNEIFATTNRTRKIIKRIALENGIDIKPNIILDDFKRSENENISFLEKNILRINNNVYEEKIENIETFIASNIKNEVQFVARKIKSLVVDKGYKYSDIAVITREISKYNGILDTVLEKFDIPYFMDAPRDIFTKPVIRFICCAVESVLSNFDRDNLLSMLKTGLINISDTELADFENYIYVWNIDRNDFKKEFKNNPSGFEVFTDSDKEKLAKIENTRKFVINPLLEFSNKCKNSDGLSITKALYNLILDFDIESNIDRLYDKLEEEGRIFEANEEVRVYNLMIESLDKLVAVVGESTLSLKTYKEYLDYKLSDITLSDIPRYQDQISVAAADRVRLSDAKVVFVIGAIDGEFPSVPKTVGVFSENERNILIENNIPLTDSLEQLACHEKYLIYCALTSTSEKLFVTTYTSDFAGNAFEPSVIFAEIERLFPNRIHSTTADFDEVDELYSKQQAFEYLSENYTENSPYINALKSYFKSDGDYIDNIIKVENTIENKPFKIADKQIAEKLFRKNMNISASQIEKYSLCAFKYFCNYGLRAKERKTASIDAIQFGNIVHYFLEKFLKENNKSVLNSL